MSQRCTVPFLTFQVQVAAAHLTQAKAHAKQLGFITEDSDAIAEQYVYRFSQETGFAGVKPANDPVVSIKQHSFPPVNIAEFLQSKPL